MPEPLTSTDGKDYAARLTGLSGVWWKRLLPVQAPYRWNLRRLRLGFTLDIGCGYGRNLNHLGGKGVGVDHNPELIAAARAQGLQAFTVDSFRSSEFNRPEVFDSLLLSHLVEHMKEAEASALLRGYLPLLKRGGKVVLITPQEAGYASDPTHVQFMDFETLGNVARAEALQVERAYSFPFPRVAGRLFTYNEFVVVCRKP